MLSKFNIVRISIFSAVMAWSLIVIGLAAHLNYLLIANDLTRFIPLAIFVAVCTFVILPTLLIFGFFNRAFLIQQVRLELPFVGILGLLWLVIGIYMVTAAEVDVECDFDEDGVFAESDEFSTDTFLAQYRTIEAFSLFNAILLLAYFFLLLLLAFRKHRLGDPQVWRSGVTAYPWFGPVPSPSSSTKAKQQQMSGLPMPVTSKVKVFAQSWLPGGKSGNNNDNGKDGSSGAGGAAGDQGPMKAGGHYIIYIPPPSSNGSSGGRR